MSQPDLQPLHLEALKPKAAPSPPTERPFGCWNHIGVHGSRTCPELDHYVHCRNCPVYSAAGHELLERALPADYRQTWTAHFALERRLPELGTTSAVPFRIGSDWLALPTHCLQEITERRPVHSVPHAGPGVLGLANIRGELLVCLSLGHVLGLANVPPSNVLRTQYNRLLVVQWNGHRAGVPVDQVDSPHRFQPQNLKPTPASLTRSHPSCTRSLLHWQERTLLLLEPDLVISALNRSFK